MLFLLYIYIFTKICFSVEGGRILVLQLIPVRSYGNFMSAIVENLAADHEIVYYNIIENDFDVPNVTFVKVPNPNFIFINQENVFKARLGDDDTTKDSTLISMSVTPTYVDYFLNSKLFQNLIHTKEKFDVLLMTYSLSEFLIPFAYHLKAPLIQVSTTVPYPWQNDAIGNPNFFSYDDNLYTPEMPDSFFNRLKKFIKILGVMFQYKWHYLPTINEATKKYFPPDTPPISIISQNTSLLLVNTVEAMGHSRPIISNYVEIGGLHCKPAKALPKDIAEFVEGAGEHGIIYFSFGSTFQAKIPNHVTKAFINVFKKLPQRIIWKANTDMRDLPENIKIFKWCPQQDILGHNKTKLFIMQGGILSLQEAIYHEVPTLVLPFLCEQPINAKYAHKLGYGRYLPLTKFSELTLEEEIKEILTQSRYRMKAKEISSLMKDVPISSADKLRWWVDYVIRHKGLPIYRPNDNRHSWYQNVNIDIILFIQLCFILILLIPIIVVILFKFLCKNHLSYIKNKSKTS